jgi:hypothetical protein
MASMELELHLRFLPSFTISLAALGEVYPTQLNIAYSYEDSKKIELPK